MITAGRWATVALFGLGGIAQLVAGTVYLAGRKKPDLQGMPVPPGSEELMVTVIGGTSLVVGLVLAVAAWGVFRWRAWARILTIILCVFQLLGLVIQSFMARLQPAVIVGGVLAAGILIWLFNTQVRAAFAAGGKQV